MNERENLCRPDDVETALEPHGLHVRLLAADSSTAVLAAQALGTTVSAIVKSLLFYIDDEPVLVLAPGDRKVDRTALAALTGGAKARLASPQEALAVTGYAVGGVPPLAHVHPLRIVMDEAIFRLPVVYAAAGAANAIFAVEPPTLQSITNADIARLTAED